MSSAGPSPTTRPSVFISYASEDRAAVRALCDTLRSAGLDLWYDENELGGGDAWDQKIRRQIRDCDYFMPVISATTERRKEGYFRREWRLAVERSLDMADDVLFLLPIVLDDTAEGGARVPEKFSTVQWLRVPGGATTPALLALAQRLIAGEHTVAPRPPLVERPRPAARAALPPPPLAPSSPTTPTPRAPAPDDAPPPMPPFPHAPEDGRVGPWCKFFAEVLWWAITAAWLVIGRLPRWLRIILAVWLVITLFGMCGRNDSPRREKNPPTAAPKVDLDEKKLEATATEAVKQIGSVIEQAIKQATGEIPATKKSPDSPPPVTTPPPADPSAAVSTPPPTEPTPPRK